MAARIVLSRTFGDDGVTAGTAGSASVRRFADEPDEDWSIAVYVERTCVRLLWSVSSCWSCSAVRTGNGAQAVDLILDLLDLGLERAELPVHEVLDIRLLSLDGGRCHDQLVGDRVRDGGRDDGIRVARADGDERAVDRRLRAHLAAELVRRERQVQRLDDTLQRGSQGCHDRVGLGESL